MHYLQTTGQNDIAVTVCTVIILVNITTDNLNAVSFLGSGKYAVTGTSCCYEQDIYAFSDQSIAQYFTGSFIREVTNIVTTYISAGNIGTCVRGSSTTSTFMPSVPFTYLTPHSKPY